MGRFQGGGAGLQTGSPGIFPESQRQLVPKFSPIGVGLLPGVPWTAVAISNDGLRAVVISGNSGADGKAAWSGDAGATWHVVTPVVGVTGYSQLVTDGVGHFLAHGQQAGLSRLVASADFGHTWADVTPVGSNPNTTDYFYSRVAHLFMFFDAAAAQMWTSPDAITWTARPLAAQLNEGGIAETATCILALGFVGPFSHILRSTDGINWTNVLTTTDDALPGAGLQMVATFGTPNIITAALTANSVGPTLKLWFSVNDGQTWALNSSSTDTTLPPFNQNLIGFRNALWNGFSSVDQCSAVQTLTGLPRDLAFIDLSGLPSLDFSFAQLWAIGAARDGTRLYAVGGGIASTLDGGVWGVALGQSTLTQVFDLKSNAGLTLAAGSDLTGNGAIWRQ